MIYSHHELFLPFGRYQTIQIKAERPLMLFIATCLTELRENPSSILMAGPGHFLFVNYFILIITAFPFQLPSGSECKTAGTLLQNLFPSIFCLLLKLQAENLLIIHVELLYPLVLVCVEISDLISTFPELKYDANTLYGSD